MSQIACGAVASVDELNEQTLLVSRDVFKRAFESFCSTAFATTSPRRIEAMGSLTFVSIYGRMHPRVQVAAPEEHDA